MVDLVEFVETAPAGKSIVYYRGGSLSDLNAPDALTLWTLRNAYNDGRVDLVQRRMTKGKGKKQRGSGFEYIAIKRRRVSPPKWATSKGTMQPVHLFHPAGSAY